MDTTDNQTNVMTNNLGITKNMVYSYLGAQKMRS